MPDTDLDTVYTALAQAIQASGKRSELYLAMLSLRLIARSGNLGASLEAVHCTLEDLESQDTSLPQRTSS